LYRRKLGRGRKLAARYVERVAYAEADTRVPEPLDWLVSDERRDLVRRALAQLAPRDAEILLLKYTEDWSYRQLADHLGLSQSAVEARLHRARARLRTQLAATESAAAQRFA
jgi:RNA polymerase sigma-70 factor (ECF subfamily)